MKYQRFIKRFLIMILLLHDILYQFDERLKFISFNLKLAKVKCDKIFIIQLIVMTLLIAD